MGNSAPPRAKPKSRSAASLPGGACPRAGADEAPIVDVFLVDACAAVRQVMAAQLARANDIRVVGAAADALFLMEPPADDRAWPHVIVLDLEMPRMDGVALLKQLMRTHPTPVVVCSSPTPRGIELALDALAAGAVEVVVKPPLGAMQFLLDFSDALVRAVRAAAQARLTPLRPAPCALAGVSAPPAWMAPRPDSLLYTLGDRVIALGMSTGGPQALEALLSALPLEVPGILVAMHLPEGYTGALAKRLEACSALEVREARGGEAVLPGRVLIAPGGRHMALKRSGAKYHVEVAEGPVVNQHRPSVNVLFRSVARAAGVAGVGVIMTGLGDDGAAGLREMRERGALTLAQEPASCAVPAMPAAALARHAAEHVATLESLPELFSHLAMRSAADADL